MQFLTYVLLGISAVTFTMAAPMEATVDEQDKGDTFLHGYSRPASGVSGTINNQGSGNSGKGVGAGSAAGGSINGGGGASSGPAFGGYNKIGHIG
ncbi:hypothetical protein ONZ45_g1829 [Pleurotus djamor]|nr:hypothetical protein ONZ45_g1829 [Pleurotus djamor]